MTLFLLLILIISGRAPAHDLKAFMAYYQKNSRTSHELTQKIITPTLKTPLESKGRIYFAQPSKFRFELDGIQKSVLSSDGKTILYYQSGLDEKDPGTLTKIPQKKTITGIWERLLSGKVIVPKDFTSETNKEGLTVLTPADRSAGIKEILLKIRSNGSLEKVTLVYFTGNKTDIDLKEPSTQFPESIFDFKVPQGTKEMPYAEL